MPKIANYYAYFFYIVAADLKDNERKSSTIINHDGDIKYFTFKNCDSIFHLQDDLKIAVE